MKTYKIEYLYRGEWLLCEYGYECPGWTGEDRLAAYIQRNPGSLHRLSVEAVG